MTLNPSIKNSASGPAENTPFQGMTLRTRLFIAFALLSLIPVLVIGSVAALISSQGLQTTAFDELESVAILKENEIHNWLEVLQTNLPLVFEKPVVRQGVLALLQNNEERLINQDRLRSDLAGFNSKTGYFVELFVMNQNGKILLSTDSTQEGKIQANKDFFQNGLQAPFVSPPVYEVSLNNYSIILSEPITTTVGGSIGVLAARVDLNTLSAIMQQETGLGEAGETYLVSSNFAALTDLKNIDFELGKTYVRTEGVTAAVKNKAAGSATYTSYAGIDTLGVYRWIPELEVALVAEHGQDTALAASNRVIQVSLILIVITSLVALGIAFLLTRAITNPITNLVTVANNIAEGNFELQAEVSHRDEIGILAQAFNRMTAQLRDFIASLEQRVADRTKALATSTEVSRRISTILEQKELVTAVVNQINSAFGYYHTQIYFYDETRANLVMAGGTGQAGKMMLAQFHKVAAGRGLVGRAAASNQPVLVANTLQNSEWLPNPLLPDTKSETAVPISIGDQVLGVLDIQHDVADGLQKEDVEVLSSIANQVAIALQNIRSTENVAKRAKELASVAEISTISAQQMDVEKMLTAVVHRTQRLFGLYHAHVFLYDETAAELHIVACGWQEGDMHEGTQETTVIPLNQEQSLVARAARTRQAVIVNNVRSESGWLPNPLLLDTVSEMAVPLLVGDRMLGVLDVQSDRLNAFTEEDAYIQKTLASQVATSLQNARTFSQSRRQAERESTLNVIGQRIQKTTSIDAALKIAVRELGHALGMKPTLVTLEPENLNGERKIDS